MELMSQIYGKGLVSKDFCNSELRDSASALSARHLTSLMLHHVDVVVTAQQHRHVLWFLPLHMCVSMMLILREVPAGAFLVMVLSVVCTASIIVSLCYTIHVTSSRHKHPASLLRVERVVELLQHYVEMALLNWQDLFIDAIHEVRQLEAERLSAQGIIKSVASTWAMVGGLLALACLVLGGAVLSADAKHATFSSPALIVAMCLTAGITSCMALYTVIFGLTCGRWHSSVEAIVPYLLVQDRSAHDIASKDRTLMGSVLQDGTIAIRIADASFVWVPKGDKRLFRLGMLDAQLSLTVRKREKIAIISPKCEGKTSFLCAIAGLMPKERGVLQLAGTMYLCLEQGVVLTGTIQDNVLFGLPYHERMYQRALYCSCLDDKLQHLRLRDQTRVGPKATIGAIGASQALDSQQLAAISLAR